MSMLPEPLQTLLTRDPDLKHRLLAYLEAGIQAWKNLPDGTPLQDVFVLLQAQERVRPTYREGEPRLPLTPEEFEEGRMPPGPGRPEARPKPPPPPVELAQALEEAHHLVLLGEPGAGKTTTLQYLALTFARAARARLQGEGDPDHTHPLALEEVRIPVFVRLAEDWPRHHPLPHALEAFPTAHLTREDWKALRDAGLLLALLDGLDEVDEAVQEALRGRIRDFRAENHRGRTIVSTRPAGYAPLPDFRDYRLVPLDDERAPRLFQNWVQALLVQGGMNPNRARDRARAGWEAVRRNPALAPLTRTPLTLKMLAEEAARNPRALARIRHRAGLYRRYVERAMQPRAKARGLDDANTYKVALHRLEIWAWHRHTQGKRTEADLRAALTRPANQAPCPADATVLLPREDEEAWRQARTHLAATGLVQPYRTPEGRVVWPFTHRTWQEYLVARRLHRAWKRDPETAWRFLQPRLHLPAWREPLMLLAGLLAGEAGEGPDAADDLIQCIWKRRDGYEPHLRRHARLALEMSVELGRVELPLRALRHGDGRVRQAAAEALGKIGAPAARHPEVLSALLQALRDEDVRWMAAWALGHLGRRQLSVQEILENLLRALQDANVEVRMAAVAVLGSLEDAADQQLKLQIRKNLYALQTDENFAVSMLAVGILTKRFRKDLLDFLYFRGQSQNRKRSSLLASLELVTVRYAERLKNLKQKDARIHLAKAMGLRRRFGEIVVQHLGRWGDLYQASKDEDRLVRGATILILGWLGETKGWSLKVIEGLLQALQEKEELVSGAAAKALGRMGKTVTQYPKVLSALLQTLQDKDGWVRDTAAEALETLLPHYEAAQAQRLPLQDPLCPPPPPRWKQVGRKLLFIVGIGIIIGFLFFVAGGEGLLPSIMQGFLVALGVEVFSWLVRWLWTRVRES